MKKNEMCEACGKRGIEENCLYDFGTETWKKLTGKHRRS